MLTPLLIKLSIFLSQELKQVSLYDDLFLKKIQFIFIFSVVCFLLLLYNNLKNKSFSKYILNTKKKLYWNFFVLIASFFIFILGLLIYRIYRQNKQVNLTELFCKLKLLVYVSPLLSTLINLGLIISFSFFMLYLVSTLLKYIKFHIIKRHIYLQNNANYAETLHIKVIKYTLIALLRKSSEITYNLISNWIKQNKFNLLLGKILYFFLQKSFKFFEWFIGKLSFFITISIILYDCLYNNFVISHIFYVLPYLFIYQIYYRVSYFIWYLNELADIKLYEILYTEMSINPYDKECIYFNERPIRYSHMRFLLDVYLSNYLHYDLDKEDEYSEYEEKIKMPDNLLDINTYIKYIKNNTKIK